MEIRESLKRESEGGKNTVKHIVFKLRQMRRRKGRYLLRSNLSGQEPQKL